MALYDHIQELRAELTMSCCKKEIRQITRQLQAAMAEQARLDAAMNEELATAT